MSEPTKLTPEELQAIRERADAATAGPWWITPNRDQLNVDITHTPQFRSMERLLTLHLTYGNHIADGGFIAHARTDIPAMLAHIAALEAENARMRAVVEAVAESGVGDEYGGGSWRRL